MCDSYRGLQEKRQYAKPNARVVAMCAGTKLLPIAEVVGRLEADKGKLTAALQKLIPQARTLSETDRRAAEREQGFQSPSRMKREQEAEMRKEARLQKLREKKAQEKREKLRKAKLERKARTRANAPDNQ